MRTVSLFLLALAALIGAPLVAADEAPSAAATLCELAQNPLTVDFEFHALCSATADCGAFPDKSCSSGGTCVGVDRNCSTGERGYVSCGGGTTYCGGPCCGQDGVCEAFYGCGCSDLDCCNLLQCQSAPGCGDPCDQDGTCNYRECGCDDPDCVGTNDCTDCNQCSSVTDCRTDADCLCPGSLCLSDGRCLCAG